MRKNSSEGGNGDGPRGRGRGRPTLELGPPPGANRGNRPLPPNIDQDRRARPQPILGGGRASVVVQQGVQLDFAHTRNEGRRRDAILQRAGADAQRTGADVQRAGADAQRAGADAQRAGADVQRAGADAQRGNYRQGRAVPEIVPSRPAGLETKTGQTGTRVVAVANYFRVLKKPEWTIYQYSIDFSPEVDNVRMRHALLAQHKEALLGAYLFDGTVMFTSVSHMNKMVNNVFELTSKSREGSVYLIKVKYVGSLDKSEEQMLRVFNLILKRAMDGLNLQLVRRNYFDPLAKIFLDTFRLEIWPGYETSIRQHETDILLCAEIAHKVMRTDSLYNILGDCIRKSRDYQYTFKQEVMGMVVLTDYNNKTYRVDDVDFDASPLSKFMLKEGEITYVQYYKTRYNINIRDTKQPLLLSRPTERSIRGGKDEVVMLVPEICRATGLTKDMRDNFRLMKAMGDHTRLNCDRRIERLMTFNRRLKTSAASVQTFQSWNMDLDSNLLTVPARILPSEKILFGNGRKYTCDTKAEWIRELRSDSMYKNVDISRWCVVVPAKFQRDAAPFVQSCIKAAQGMKMRISEPIYEVISDDRNGAYSQAIDVAAAKDPQIIMLVVPNVSEDKYACIKKKCCVDRPVPSQVISMRTIGPKNKGLMSIATKVVIQLNAKLMGAPWMVDVPVRGLMTIGFDVSHSTKSHGKSFGAMVATMDMQQSTRYFSTVNEHIKGQELSNEITMNVTLALKAYREEHKVLPERILFYRDGVGQSQLHQVVNTEVQHLKKKLDEIYRSAGSKGCRLCFIVVSKRINTRYFVNSKNPVPGTVVDDVITLPERYDFFLVSQSVNQGTVSPTCYNIVHDTMGFSADRLQLLTYKMTHMYYNWTGTLRIPAVCQYAHKLAMLVADTIHRAPHTSLEKNLYFL